jgi:hypothetical protein
MTLDELQRCFDIVMRFARARGLDGVEQGGRDLYWTALDEEWTRMDIDPRPGTGSLSDDLGELGKLLQDPERASPVDFARLGNALRLLGENVSERD